MVLGTNNCKYTFIQENLTELVRAIRVCGFWTKTQSLPSSSHLHDTGNRQMQPRIGFLLLPLSWRAISPGGAGYSISHPTHSYPLLCLSSRSVCGGEILKLPFSISHQPWNIGTTLDVTRWKNYGPHGHWAILFTIHKLELLSWKRQAEKTWGYCYSCHHALSSQNRVSLREKCAISQLPTRAPWLKFCTEREVYHQKAPNLFLKELTIYNKAE